LRETTACRTYTDRGYILIGTADIYREQKLFRPRYSVPFLTYTIYPARLLLLGVVFALLTSCQPEQHGVLTSAAQINALSEVDAERGLPARIEGVVTQWDHRQFEMVVQDETGGVPVYFRSEGLSVSVGNRIAVEGRVRPLGFQHIIEATHHEVTPTDSLPAPLLPDIDELITPDLEHRFVKVEGEVVSVERSDNHFYRVALHDTSDSTDVLVSLYNDEVTRLVGDLPLFLVPVAMLGHRRG